ncbi:MAG: serine protease, partial [Patescibacteria group bacterium]
ALVITLNGLYGNGAATTPPVTGIFGPVATSTVPSITAPAVTFPTPSLSTPKPTTSSALALFPNAPSANLALALTSLKNASVNIMCVSKVQGIRSMSGSGVIFDSRGLILTNSHIAQYYLLESSFPKGSISCTVRTGSPAQSAYKAKLAYLSSQWLAANPYTLTATVPRGTGEHDFAVLVITESATPFALPTSFPAMALAKNDVKTGDGIAIASYAAQSLTAEDVRNNLYPTLVFGSVASRYNFTRGSSADLLSLGGSAAAQEGSSGAGVANEKGELVGIVTTSSQTGPLLMRDLRAVTVSHIRKSFTADSGEDFDSYFKYSTPSDMIAVFIDDVATEGSFLRGSIGL